MIPTLTAPQCAAAESAARFTVVRSGPGSGKTTVIVARIAHLVSRGAAPDEIRALTFTRSAADGIRARLAAQIGEHAAARVDVTTFHGLALRLVAASDPSFSSSNPTRVATEAEEAAIFETLFDGPSRRSDVPGKKVVRQQIREFEARREFVPTCKPLRILIQRFQDRGLLPMWSLIPFALHRSVGDPRRVILVDEAQDCTGSEGLLAQHAATPDASWTIVGDPRQAIMSWRGAAPDAFGFAENDRTLQLALGQSFRFGQAVAVLANRVAEVFGGTSILGLGGESEVVLDGTMYGPIDAVFRDPANSAVLCRTNAHAAWCEARLEGLGVHVKRDPLDPFAHESDRFAEVAKAGKVVISTIHAAKGREWDHVVIPPHEFFPEDDAEDWRVLYVAVTRAKKRLTICGLSRLAMQALCETTGAGAAQGTGLGDSIGAAPASSDTDPSPSAALQSGERSLLVGDGSALSGGAS